MFTAFLGVVMSTHFIIKQMPERTLLIPNHKIQQCSSMRRQIHAIFPTLSQLQFACMLGIKQNIRRRTIHGDDMYASPLMGHVNKKYGRSLGEDDTWD